MLYLAPFLLFLYISPSIALLSPQAVPVCPIDAKDSPDICPNFMPSLASRAVNMMKAVVIRHAGGPEVLKVESVPLPSASPGHVRIRVKAFGINRSEMFTRQGHSPVEFPRILGIEAAGTVDEAPGGEFQPGETVVTAMGGMGRNFDGGYAEYTVVPAKQVKAVRTKASWEVLGALPEMLQTAWGSLHTSLRIASGEKLLVRGGTTAIGLAAAAIAKKYNLSVVSTTRRADRVQLLKDHGVDDVIIDQGQIAEQVKEKYPAGFDKVLELIGPVTLEDSMKCVKQHGTACLSGIVGGTWTWSGTLIGAIPKARYLTTYGGSSDDLLAMPFDELVQDVVDGKMHINIGKVFNIDEIVDVHRLMDSNEAGGKIVVLT